MQVTRTMVLILSAVVATSSAKNCNRRRSCEDCASSKSWWWSGENCRWCPRDNQCHLYGSPQNKCKRAENIVNERDCAHAKLSKYDPGLAHKMLLLSSVAYDWIHTEQCLENALHDFGFEKYRYIPVICDFFDNKCAALVAISHKEKVIAVAFKGSVDFGQVVLEALETLFAPKQPFAGGEVQTYWKRAFDKLWEPCLKSTLKSAHQEYPSYKLWITGHSLGGALASMLSTWIAKYENKMFPKQNIIMYTFGMPRVGNYDYAFEHDKNVKDSWRVVNQNDPIPHFPSMASVNVKNGPYHHGIEAYYSRGTTSNPKTGYKECHGWLYNEDKSCSFTDPQWKYSIERHKVYFDIPVGTYYEAECKKGGKGKRAVKNATSTVEFLSECSSSKLPQNKDHTHVLPDISENTVVDVSKDLVDSGTDDGQNISAVVAKANIESGQSNQPKGVAGAVFISFVIVITLSVIGVFAFFKIKGRKKQEEQIPLQSNDAQHNTYTG